MARYSELSPVELVRECAGARDTELWAEFIRRFQPVIAAAVLRTARQRGEPSRQLLDDLIQDTYLKLCENESRLLRSFQPRHEDSIYGYLKVVAANVVHDHFKSALAGKRGAAQTEAIDELLNESASAIAFVAGLAIEPGQRPPCGISRCGGRGRRGSRA